LEESFREAAARYDFAVRAVELGSDYAHVSVGAYKNLAVSELVRFFNGASLRRLRERCWNMIRNKLWGDAFWTADYFYRSVGATTNDAIKRALIRQRLIFLSEPEVRRSK